MSVVKSLAVGCAMTAAASMSAGAATIDSSASGVQGSNGSPLILPEATIANLTGTTVLVGPGAAGVAPTDPA